MRLDRWRRLWFGGFLAAVVWLSSPSAAVLTRAWPATQAQAGFEVRGTVVDGVTGLPVEGARVTLVGRSRSVGVTVLTDERGVFVMRAPSAGEYSLSASIADRAIGEYDSDPFSGVVRWFLVTDRTGGIVIKLWTLPRATGSVIDENDQPLAGATVVAAETVTLGDQDVLKLKRRTITDRNGAYALQMPPGRYVMAAFARSNASSPARPVVYYPNVTRVAAASTLELEKGRTASVDFQLGRERGFAVSGVLELPAGLERPNAVELFETSPGEPAIGWPIASAALSKLGTFAMPLMPPGSYEIRFVQYPEHGPTVVPDGAVRYNDQRSLPPQRLARVPDGETWWAIASVSLVDEDVNTSVVLRPGVSVKGRLVFEGPRDPPGAEELPMRGVYLQSVDHRFFRPHALGSAREDGTFSTASVPPGRYVLGMTSAYAGYQLQSVKIGGREVGGMSFELGTDVRDAVMTFSSHETVIRGSVSGKPDRLGFVLVWPEDEMLWSGRGTELGRVKFVRAQTGAYYVSVFPGAYRVIALEGLPPPNWESSRYLRSLRIQSQRVDVQAGQTVVHNLTVATFR